MCQISFSEAFLKLRFVASEQDLRLLEPGYLWMQMENTILGVEINGKTLWIGYVHGSGLKWARSLIRAMKIDGTFDFLAWDCRPGSFSDAIGTYCHASREENGKYPDGTPKIRREISLQQNRRLSWAQAGVAAERHSNLVTSQA